MLWPNKLPATFPIDDTETYFWEIILSLFQLCCLFSFLFLETSLLLNLIVLLKAVHIPNFKRIFQNNVLIVAANYGFQKTFWKRFCRLFNTKECFQVLLQLNAIILGIQWQSFPRMIAKSVLKAKVRFGSLIQVHALIRNQCQEPNSSSVLSPFWRARINTLFNPFIFWQPNRHLLIQN